VAARTGAQPAAAARWLLCAARCCRALLLRAARARGQQNQNQTKNKTKSTRRRADDHNMTQRRPAANVKKNNN
jgi:hypothetical protein